MAITPRHTPHLSTLIAAMLCTCVSSGCRTLTIPWEHPAVFKKTPVCDSAGNCNQNCYVPPPPVMNSDCYGYRFTCWHPWPEHCQPQCNDGCESTPVHIAPTPAEALPMSSQPSPPVSPPTHAPETAPMEPMIPAETMPESPPAPQSSYPSYSDRHTTMRDSAPSHRSNYETNSRGSAQTSAMSASNYASPTTPDYRYLSAVANSPADREPSTYTTSGARYADRDAGAETRSSSPSATSQHAVERFRW